MFEVGKTYSNGLRTFVVARRTDKSLWIRIGDNVNRVKLYMSDDLKEICYTNGFYRGAIPIRS